MKQVIFISGGESFETREDFKQWLKSFDSDFMLSDPSIESAKFWSRNLDDDLGGEYEVLSISMPLKINARYEEWKIWFEKHIQFMNEEVALVGWSLGANFLAKYLSENTFEKRISTLHLVAGCYGCVGGFNLDSVSSIQKQTKNIFIYHSLDDTVVPYQEALSYSKDLPEATLITYEKHGHFLVEHVSEIVENINSQEF